MDLCNYEVFVVSTWMSLLDLVLHFDWRHSSECEVVGAVELDQRQESSKSMILWLFSKPIPLSPSVGKSCIIGSIVGKTDRPHDSGVEVWSNGLIGKGGNVIPCANVCIHSRVEDASWFIRAEDCVVGDDGAIESKEVSSPVDNKEIASACAKDITASSEPSDLTGAVLVSIEVAALIAVEE